MSKKMKALRKTSPEAGAELQEISIPNVKPGMILVKVEVAAICGTDKTVYNWNDKIASVTNLPFTMGHEYCGKVVAVGEYVQNFSVGDQVAGETHVPCGRCYMCKSGNPHICINMENVGKTWDGCFAEYIMVPEACVIRVPESIDPKLGAILEPLGVAVHALQKTNPCGESVVVFGCGPIGLMVIAVAQYMGAHNIFAVSRTEAKLEMAKKLGASYILNSKESDVVEDIKAASNGEGVDIVIETSGSEEAFIQGLESLKNLGRFCLVGIPTKSMLFDAERYLVRKEFNITGIWGRRMYSTWMLVENLISKGNLNLTPLIGSAYPLEDFIEAFNEATSDTVQRVFLVPD